MTQSSIYLLVIANIPPKTCSACKDSYACHQDDKARLTIDMRSLLLLSRQLVTSSDLVADKWAIRAICQR